MFCPECGKQIADTSKFCQYCGAKITSVDLNEATESSRMADMASSITTKEDVSPVQSINPTPKKNTKKTVIIVAVALLLCAAVGYFLKLTSKIEPLELDEVNGSPDFYNLSWGMDFNQVDDAITTEHDSFYYEKDVNYASMIYAEDKLKPFLGFALKDYICAFNNDNELDFIILDFEKASTNYDDLLNVLIQRYGEQTEPTVWYGKKTTIYLSEDTDTYCLSFSDPRSDTTYQPSSYADPAEVYSIIGSNMKITIPKEANINYSESRDYYLEYLDGKYSSIVVFSGIKNSFHVDPENVYLSLIYNQNSYDIVGGEYALLIPSKDDEGEVVFPICTNYSFEFGEEVKTSTTTDGNTYDSQDYVMKAAISEDIEGIYTWEWNDKGYYIRLDLQISPDYEYSVATILITQSNRK